MIKTTALPLQEQPLHTSRTVREHFHSSGREALGRFLGQKGRHIFATQVRRGRAVHLQVISGAFKKRAC
jgi:hypothetical protein